MARTKRLSPPLSPAELRAQPPPGATAEPPDDFRARQSRNTMTMFFAAEANRMRMLAPSINVHEVEHTRRGSAPIWQVDVEMDGVMCTHPAMTRSARIAKPARRPANSARALDGHRPPWLAMGYRPRRLKRPDRPTIRGRDKRTYQPLFVFPDDSRQLLTDTRYPFSCIGKVEFGDDRGSGSATGSLVGEDFIVTALHAIPRGNNAWMKFTALYWDGQSRLGKGFWSYATEWRAYDEDSDLDYKASHDYAIVRLGIPLGRSLGYFGASEFDDDWRGQKVFSGVGYPGDMFSASRPVIQYNWWMEDDYEDDDGQSLETEASLDHGQSGGPFYAYFPDARIVGVVVGGGNLASGDNDNILAGGPNLLDLINWGRANWG